MEDVAGGSELYGGDVGDFVRLIIVEEVCY